MSFVGLDIDKCTELKTHLDQACQDLNAHADSVEAALKAAGIGKCNATAEIRDVAAWADYRSRDLQKRIDRARAADTGAPWGFRFGGNRAAASEAGVAEAEKIKDLLSKVPPDMQGVEAELAKVKAKADDPAFATAFIHRLGAAKLAGLLKGIDDPDALHPMLSHDALGVLATMLASVSKAKPDDEVLSHLVAKASPGELATLLEFPGYGSYFVADAARVVLSAYNPAAASFAAGGGLGEQYRAVTLHALQNDPRAAFLSIIDGNGKANDAVLRSLMANGDRDGGKLAASVLRAGLLDFPYGPHGKDTDRVAADVAMNQAMGLVNHGQDLSDPARQALAAALYPRFADGRIADIADNASPDSPAYKNVQKFLTELMRSDQARATLSTEASAWIAPQIRGGLAASSDPDSRFAFASTASDVARLLNLMNKSANAVIDSRVEQANFVAGIVKAAAGMAVGGLTSPLGPGEAIVAAGVGNFLADQAISKIVGDDAAAMMNAKNGLGRDADTAITVLIAQYLYTHPDPKAPPTIKLNDPHFHPPLDNAGNLRVPETPDELTAFDRWLAANDINFKGLVRDYQQQVSHELASEITLGE